MSGHTEGEWKYGADKCADNADAMRICKENIDAHDKPSSGWFWVVYLADGRRTALVGHGPDGEANARLIAAAPDFYAMAEMVLAWWDKHQYDTISGADGEEWNVHDYEPDFVTTARAAKAKADGETT